MPPPPRNFAVRVFKGPTLSTFPHNATAKFDVGYRSNVNADPRQTQNWYSGRPEPSRQQQPPVSVSIPRPKAARFGGSWNENRGGRDTPHPANYADFIYERSLSSKSDIYSDESPSTSVSTTPTSLFSPAFSANSSLTSTPSDGVPSNSNTPTPRHNTFPLNLPALTQAQSAIRSLFVHPNGDISQTQQSGSSPPIPIPGAPVARPTLLPLASPPRLFQASSSEHTPLSESPQEDPMLIVPPPRSESEATVGEAERLALRNAQMNAAGSLYYQAGFRMQRTRSHSSSRSRSPEQGTTVRSVASSSSSMTLGGAGVYESSSIVNNCSPPSTRPPSTRTSPIMVPAPPRVAYVASDSSMSSVTVVDSHEPMAISPSRARVDSFALNARNLNVPVSQLVELGSPNREHERMRIMTAGEELRGLNIYSNVSVIPTVIRSHSGDDRSGDDRRSPVAERPRRASGNLWNSTSQLPDRERRSPTQPPARPSSTPPIPLPRIDTSGGRTTMSGGYNGLPAPPPPTPVSAQQSPTYRAPPPIPPPLLPPNTPTRARTPVVAGPRVLPAEPVRRRSDGDQPMNGLLQRTSALFHGNKSPSSEGRETSTARPGALPLDPQRRRSDGFQSVVPPRPSPIQTPPLPPMPPSRNVRWNENLVCPSPIFASQRRKGWFNRRGDQLWTNDGGYKPVAKGQEFPNELRDYPEFGAGWMNEDCVRIDMGHRLIPRMPLRSALKQPRGPVIQVNPGGP
ncbi:hypothetical protein C8F01DRAFT_311377 [Mycena amicta]|nr:hypothetical protein C8F01DRAFT_311377 [Mycena amicta]